VLLAAARDGVALDVDKLTGTELWYYEKLQYVSPRYEEVAE
jgi:hypothetical protein